MNRRFVARRVVLALAALLCVSAAGSQPIQNPVRDFARRLGFDDAGITSLGRGGVIVKTLEASVGSEIAVAGAVRVDVPREYFVRRWRDIASFKRGAKVPEIGTFGNPSAVHDLDTLAVPAADVAALRTCRIGRCDVKLPVETFGLLQSSDADAHATADRANVHVFKEMLTARVQAFRSGGAGALTPTGGNRSDPPRTAIEAILAAVPDTLQDVPEFRAYLAHYPGGRLADVEELSYWSKETPGPKPIISLTHLSVYTKTFDATTITFGTATNLYSSHYIDGSMSFTVAIEANDQRGASFYLFYANRSRIDALKGMFGGLGRWMVKRRVRSGLRETLTQTKRRLEEGYRTESDAARSRE